MLTLGANEFLKMMLLAKEELKNKAEEINGLNVFPVPDGDTGSNMSMTMDGISFLSKEDTASIGKSSKAIADGMLRCARGNSGVILSVFFKGIAKALKEKEEANATDIAEAFSLGVSLAYDSVMNPTEGTILTVMRESAETAKSSVENCPSIELEDLFDSITAAATEALMKTPELLPMLKQAGVVDAGGCGFVTILSGIRASLKGEKAPKSIDFSSLAKPNLSAAAQADFDARYPYCTECIVEKSDAFAGENTLSEFHTFVLGAGDSAVFVEDEEIVKVHVHTANPGRVLEEAIKYGSLLTVKIENMKKQHSELTLSSPNTPSFSKQYGFVAVANGDGICDVFRDLGVDELVIGGQTMNPSTDDILAAIAKVDAENVYVFPNNSNIVMVAQQAAAIASENGKSVTVIRSKSIPQGISAMYAFDNELSPYDNTAAMSLAISGVTTLSVTYAVRDARIDELEIKEGQYLGLVENKVKIVEATLESCLCELCEKLTGKDCITVFYGADISEDEMEKYASIIDEKLGDDIDITYISGGQPIYSFIISGE